MPNYRSPKLTITLPADLLQQVDRLAAYEYAGRSVIIRQAVAEYVRKPEHVLIADPDSVATDKQYKYIKADHKYLDPSDRVLVQFLYEQKIKKERGA